MVLNVLKSPWEVLLKNIQANNTIHKNLQANREYEFSARSAMHRVSSMKLFLYIEIFGS